MKDFVSSSSYIILMGAISSVLGFPRLTTNMDFKHHNTLRMFDYDKISDDNDYGENSARYENRLRPHRSMTTTELPSEPDSLEKEVDKGEDLTEDIDAFIDWLKSVPPHKTKKDLMVMLPNRASRMDGTRIALDFCFTCSFPPCPFGTVLTQYGSCAPRASF